jgi:hypothetical protein
MVDDSHMWELQNVPAGTAKRLQNKRVKVLPGRDRHTGGSEPGPQRAIRTGTFMNPLASSNFCK